MTTRNFQVASKQSIKMTITTIKYSISLLFCI